MKKTMVIFIYALILVGCMSAGTKVERNQLSSFEKGKTTYSDVVAALGTPQVVTSQSDGKRSISYAYSQASPNAASFIPFIGGIVGTTEGEVVMVTILFDTENKLESFSHSQSKSSYGIGGLKSKKIE